MRLVAVAIWILSAGLASAQTNPEQSSAPALQAVYACTQNEDDAARLACYDAAVGRLREQQRAGEVVAIDRTQATEMQREGFGFSLPSLATLMPRFGEASDIERLEVQIESVVPTGAGRHRFNLTNGQHWSQVEARSVRNVRPGDTVTIRRAALGSYMLLPSDERGGASYRVHRDE